MKPVSGLVLMIAAFGCGARDDATERADSVSGLVPAVAVTRPRSDSTRQASRDVCPATGKWALCSLETRLRRSGFVAKRVDGEKPARAGFSVAPVIYTLGHGRLEVFLYDDDGSLARDIAGIDTLTVAPPGAVTAWPSPPALVRSENLVAVYMDQTARQAERLVLAITAGPPTAR